ncbi:MAG: acyl-CoA thioesterase [Actinomycetia bacterium]|nr:acyl-CoA thioesterase [Actinomycetes bacterium]
MAYSSTIDVRFSELDPYGHVNHAVYLIYFEVARTEALASVQLPIDEIAERGNQLVVTGIEVRFRKAAMAGDRLTVETSIAEKRRASTVWSQRILRGDEVMVTGTVTIGITDNTGKPCKPPDWLFPGLQLLLD